MIPFDPVGELLRLENDPLHPFFSPKSVAVVGATEKMGSVGRTVFWNLISNPFGGTVYPVNSQRASILGIRAYPSVSTLPEKVDLVVVCTPARSVPEVIKECAECGIKAAVIISAGFKELGAPGEELERQVLAHARSGGMRIIGPNCLGVMNPLSGLNATFAGGMARPGNVAFISQSGALCTAILDWSLGELVGFSAFVSIGSMLDVDWGSLIQYFGQDPRTESIVIYMESIGSARSFLSAAREVALNKPIIVIKAGRTDEAAKAAASHTGSLTGSDDVLDVAFRRVGVLRVDRIADLFYMAEVLGKQPRPKGPRLSIVTNAGGPGVLATDSLITTGGQLAALSPETRTALDAILPPHWSRNNPIDILGDAAPERYAQALEIAAKDPNTDGMLVILTPQDMTDPTQTAEKLKAYAKIEGKPVIASWMGGAQVQAGVDILNRANIPTFSYPDTAVRVFNYMCQYSKNLRLLYETPSLKTETWEPDRAGAAAIIDDAMRQGRNLLTEDEAKRLLATYGIPVVQTEVAKDPDAAAKLAEKHGFPVVLKLFSETITHKTDVGGVILDVRSAAQVKNAFNMIKESVTEKAGAQHFQGVTVQPMLDVKEGYELILGSSFDPQFGPVLLFGLGGQLVEVFKDRALGLPPLNTVLARSMLERTKIFKALQGVRGRAPVNMEALENLLVRFSLLVVEQRRVKESDINPLFASTKSLVALDARFVLFDEKTDERQLPTTAIRPYPIHQICETTIKDGSQVLLRPIRPEDEPLMIEFHEALSDKTVFFRYGDNLDLPQRTHHERLIRVCFVDYDRKIVLVAKKTDASGKRHIIGVGRLNKLPGGDMARVALLVADPFQRQGVGTALLKQLLAVAQEEKLARIEARVLPENRPMLNLLSKHGFIISQPEDEKFARAELTV